jgi:hypothetical protein
MIYLIVGHHSKIQGASYNGTSEWRAVNGIFRNVYMYSHVKLILNGGSIAEKNKTINARMQPEDICIECHMNAPGENNTGAMIYYHNDNPDARSMATRILDLYCKGASQRQTRVLSDTASRFKRLGMIRGMKYRNRSFILELGFISNLEDLKFCKSNAHHGLNYLINNLTPRNEKLLLKQKIERLQQAIENNPPLADNLTKIRNNCMKRYLAM